MDASNPGIWPTALEFETVMLRSGGAGLLRPSSKTSPIAIWEYMQSDDLCGWLCNVTLVESKKGRERTSANPMSLNHNGN